MTPAALERWCQNDDQWSTSKRNNRDFAQVRFLPPPPTLAVLELVAQRQERQVKDRAEASAQTVVVDRVRVLEIVLEHLDELVCERAVHEGHVELVVERKRAIVEVGATDTDPAL